MSYSLAVEVLTGVISVQMQPSVNRLRPLPLFRCERAGCPLLVRLQVAKHASKSAILFIREGAARKQGCQNTAIRHGETSVQRNLSILSVHQLGVRS